MRPLYIYTSTRYGQLVTLIFACVFVTSHASNSAIHFSSFKRTLARCAAEASKTVPTRNDVRLRSLCHQNRSEELSSCHSIDKMLEQNWKQLTPTVEQCHMYATNLNISTSGSKSGICQNWLIKVIDTLQTNTWNHSIISHDLKKKKIQNVGSEKNPPYKRTMKMTTQLALCVISSCSDELLDLRSRSLILGMTLRIGDAFSRQNYFVWSAIMYAWSMQIIMSSPYICLDDPSDHAISQSTEMGLASVAYNLGLSLHFMGEVSCSKQIIQRSHLLAAQGAYCTTSTQFDNSTTNDIPHQNSDIIVSPDGFLHSTQISSNGFITQNKESLTSNIDSTMQNKESFPNVSSNRSIMQNEELSTDPTGSTTQSEESFPEVSSNRSIIQNESSSTINIGSFIQNEASSTDISMQQSNMLQNIITSFLGTTGCNESNQLMLNSSNSLVVYDWLEYYENYLNTSTSIVNITQIYREFSEKPISPKSIGKIHHIRYNSGKQCERCDNTQRYPNQNRWSITQHNFVEMMYGNTDSTLQLSHIPDNNSHEFQDLTSNQQKKNSYDKLSIFDAELFLVTFNNVCVQTEEGIITSENEVFVPSGRHYMISPDHTLANISFGHLKKKQIDQAILLGNTNHLYDFMTASLPRLALAAEELLQNKEIQIIIGKAPRMVYETLSMLPFLSSERLLSYTPGRERVCVNTLKVPFWRPSTYYLHDHDHHDLHYSRDMHRLMNKMPMDPVPIMPIRSLRKTFLRLLTTPAQTSSINIQKHTGIPRRVRTCIQTVVVSLDGLHNSFHLMEMIRKSLDIEEPLTSALHETMPYKADRDSFDDPILIQLNLSKLYSSDEKDFGSFISAVDTMRHTDLFVTTKSREAMALLQFCPSKAAVMYIGPVVRTHQHHEWYAAALGHDVWHIEPTSSVKLDLEQENSTEQTLHHPPFEVPMQAVREALRDIISERGIC